MLPQLEYSGVLEMWIISSEFKSEVFGEIQVCLKQHLLVMMVLYKHGGGVQMKKTTACTLFMVKLAEESGKKPVILLYIYFSQLTVSHSEKNEDKNKAFFISHNTTRMLFNHYLYFKQSISLNWFNLVFHYMVWFCWEIEAGYALAPIKHSVQIIRSSERGQWIYWPWKPWPWVILWNSMMSRIKISSESLPRSPQTVIILHNRYMFWSKHKLCLDIKHNTSTTPIVQCGFEIKWAQNHTSTLLFQLWKIEMLK